MAGDMSFTDLYDRYFGKVYNYVRYHVRVPDEADDVTGRIFEAALKAYGAYDPAKAPVHAWLFGIARNAVIDWARGRRPQVPLDEIAEMAGSDPRADAVLEDKEQAGLLLEAVGTLDERSRDIIALKFSSGMTNRDIAAMTGLGESNVGILVYRAVKKMQTYLQGRGKL
jgi:RNA polymerase sigma-70 factor (ECF subfamily)